MAVLGVDFGTSNSAAGVAVNGAPHLIAMEPGASTLPTAVFFPEGGAMRIGSRAVAALTDGDDGRYMQALKSLLGTPLLYEERRFGRRRMSFADIVTGFLSEVKTRSEAATGLQFNHALSGRPVHFHSRDAARDAQAEADLRQCYHAAGFDEVRFLYEPEAALRAAPSRAGLGLIVDIGGGTTDFTVFRQGAGAPEILASYGVRLGGTDLDRRLSIAHVMPLLGKGTAIRDSFGQGTLPAPNRIFNDLATWQMIPFLYAPEARRAVADLRRGAVDPAPLQRLQGVLEDELGHDLAFAVERGKILCNREGTARIGLGVIEPGLGCDLTRAAMEHSLHEELAQIRAAAAEALAQGGVDPAQVTRLVMVGGSSLLHAVRRDLQTLCPGAQIESDNALTAVADGLALAAETAFAE